MQARHNIIIVGMSLCRHGSVLCGYHNILPGMILGRFSAVTIICISLLLLQQVWPPCHTCCNDPRPARQCPILPMCHTYCFDPRPVWYSHLCLPSQTCGNEPKQAYRCLMWPPYTMCWNQLGRHHTKYSAHEILPYEK